MAYNVTIKYFGVEKTAENIVAPICSIFEPKGSYVDSKVFTEGLTKADGTVVYGKSIYATNTRGFGIPFDPEIPFKGGQVPLPVPMAQFNAAVVGEEKTDSTTGKTYHEVTFAVEDYKEAFYYKEMGVALYDQGFVVSVENATASGSGASAVTPTV